MTSVSVVGLGNIGSQLVPHIGRMAGITAITLVDHDTYDNSNLVSQGIDRSALGAPKVNVQKAVLRAINPAITVHAVQDRVENVPVAALRSAILLSCPDNRRARQTINRAAFRCGKPLIDAAVDTVSLVRISTFMPGKTTACIECSWDDSVYSGLPQEYPCDAAGPAAPATDAPAELGALAAALQAAELRKLLGSCPDIVGLSGSVLVFDTKSHMAHRYRVRRNDVCRFDHDTWNQEILELDPAETTLADLFDATHSSSDSAITLEEQVFARKLHCTACGKESSIDLALGSRLPAAARSCGCGGRMLAAGFFSSEAIRRSDCSRDDLRLCLDAMGFRTGDLLSASDPSTGVRHFEIGGKSRHV